MSDLDPLYVKQMELGPMQNFVYESEGAEPPSESSPRDGARAEPALEALRSG